MSRPLYAIPILNELHELYPDLLYHPSRFQSGNDVITYIVDRGIRRSFREESLQYHRRVEQQAVQAQVQQQPNSFDEFNAIVYGIAPRIYPSASGATTSGATTSGATTSAATTSVATGSAATGSIAPVSNEFIPLLASPIDQLLSYFIRESMDDHSAVPSSLRPTEDQLREHTTVQTLTEHPEADCAICQDAMVIGQTTRRLPCQHTFHLSCVDAWFSSRPTCPTCRHDVRLE